MKIQYASDLHLEFLENRRYLNSMPIEPVGDILVLAGDIVYLKDRLMEQSRFFRWASEHFQQTLIVPGNHEFYGGCDISRCVADFKYRIRDNVEFYNNRSTRIDDTEFFLTTLWSHIPKLSEKTIETGMNDFYHSKFDGNKLTVDIYNRLHAYSLAWLDTALAESTALHKVVISHHCPTLQMCTPEELCSPLNPAFTTELSGFIKEHDIDYWICGHTHSNYPAIRIGKTTIVNNMLGYVEYETVHKSFKHDAMIELIY